MGYQIPVGSLPQPWDENNEFQMAFQTSNFGLCVVKESVFTYDVYTNVELHDESWDHEKVYEYPRPHAKSDLIRDMDDEWKITGNPRGNWKKTIDNSSKESALNPDYRAHH